ncbi:MAG: TerC/Alx family metal homeostasis membrane protein [Phycisphaeraceae bacterium]|nr:TerC/Alx family metal homeostasis membrane protein [Phycisphaeraceae bacterium]
MPIANPGPEALAFTPWLYAAFVGVVLFLLALDLGVFHRKSHAPTIRESLAWTAVWISVALLFAGAVFVLYEHHFGGLGTSVPVLGSPGEAETISGWDATRLYLTAYLVEKSLSLDNVFVISMIFTSLAIPVALQHRVLFWGILGALVMRGLMIGAGAAIVAEFAWVAYVFGAVLVFSALKMALSRDDDRESTSTRFVRFISRVVPVSPRLEGQKLLARIDGRLHATPLLVALVIVEATDVLFAVDSIPAVFAITSDPFIVFTSNIMAVLGLRSLYFCLASAVLRFRYLKSALVAVLLFVGIKICLVHTAWKIPSEVSTAVVLAILTSGIAASVLARRGAVETPLAEGIVPDGPAPSISLPRRLLLLWRSNRTIRRVAVLTAGSLVILCGLIISPLPGPGLTILGPLGVGILASEFLWARRVAASAVARDGRVRVFCERFLVRVSRLYIVPVVAGFWACAWLLARYTPAPPWLVWSIAVPAFTPVCYVLYRWYQARARQRSATGSGWSKTGG